MTSGLVRNSVPKSNKSKPTRKIAFSTEFQMEHFLLFLYHIITKYLTRRKLPWFQQDKLKQNPKNLRLKSFWKPRPQKSNKKSNQLMLLKILLRLMNQMKLLSNRKLLPHRKWFRISREKLKSLRPMQIPKRINSLQEMIHHGYRSMRRYNFNAKYIKLRWFTF